jgi:hypothetical protein
MWRSSSLVLKIHDTHLLLIVFEKPNIKHEMMIKNPRLFVSLLYSINVVGSFGFILFQTCFIPMNHPSKHRLVALFHGDKIIA